MRPFEKRFGMVAVGKGFITLEQLLEAMKKQISEDVSQEAHRLIGEIMIDMGLLTPPQVKEILDSLDRDADPSDQSKVRE